VLPPIDDAAPLFQMEPRTAPRARLPPTDMRAGRAAAFHLDADMVLVAGERVRIAAGSVRATGTGGPAFMADLVGAAQQWGAALVLGAAVAVVGALGVARSGFTRGAFRTVVAARAAILIVGLLVDALGVATGQPNPARLAVRGIGRAACSLIADSDFADRRRRAITLGAALFARTGTTHLAVRACLPSAGTALVFRDARLAAALLVNAAHVAADAAAERVSVGADAVATDAAFARPATALAAGGSVRLIRVLTRVVRAAGRDLAGLRRARATFDLPATAVVDATAFAVAGDLAAGRRAAGVLEADLTARAAEAGHVAPDEAALAIASGAVQFPTTLAVVGATGGFRFAAIVGAAAFALAIGVAAATVEAVTQVAFAVTRAVAVEEVAGRAVADAKRTLARLGRRRDLAVACARTAAVLLARWRIAALPACALRRVSLAEAQRRQCRRDAAGQRSQGLASAGDFAQRTDQLVEPSIVHPCPEISRCGHGLNCSHPRALRTIVKY
jgi:hypothetical protein